MCSRYTLHAPAETVASAFSLPGVPVLTPRYNIALSQPVAVIGVRTNGRRGLEMFRWGLVSRWAVDPNAEPPPIALEAETAAQWNSFRDRRCLVPADGWYEWGPPGGDKAPHYIRPRTGGPLAFAGVWDAWRPKWMPALDPPLLTCAVLTVAAVGPLRAVHERMPLVLPPDRWDRWLNPSAPVADLLPLLVPPPADQFEVVRVGPLVDELTNDGPECLVPAA